MNAYSDVTDEQRWVSREFDGDILNLTIHDNVSIDESALVIFTVRSIENDSTISIVALNIADGSVKWQHTTSIDLHPYPGDPNRDIHAWSRSLTLAGNKLLLTFGNKIISFNASTGDVLWTHEEPTGQFKFQCVSSNGFLYCLHEFIPQPFAISWHLNMFNVETGQQINPYDIQESGGLGYTGDNDKDIMAIDQNLLVIQLGSRITALQKAL